MALLPRTLYEARVVISGYLTNRSRAGNPFTPGTFFVSVDILHSMGQDPTSTNQITVYRFRFTMSQFLSFQDHILSCNGIVHELPIRSSPDIVSVLTILANSALGPNPYLLNEIPEDRNSRIAREKLREDEACKFDSAYQAMFDPIPVRPLLKRIEFGLVESGNEWVLLLLESPEPLIWERIDLTAMQDIVTDPSNSLHLSQHNNNAGSKSNIRWEPIGSFC
jgi:hypothetical protein